MRVYTKLSAVIADDAGLDRRLFSIEDIEENDDSSVKGGGGPGGFTLLGSAQVGYAPLDVSLQAASPAKQIVLLVNGSVNVTLNGSNVAIPVASTGTGSTFVWGKLVLTGSAVTAIRVANASTSNTASCMLGYAG